VKAGRQAARLLVALLLILPAACASMSGNTPATNEPAKTGTSIGPYSEFSGRLLVMEPKRRWQVLLQWRALQPDSGWLRLTHAASSTVVELRWQHQDMQMRDNSSNDWREISPQQLAEQGIVLPPRQLASLLLGKTPDHFQLKAGKDGDDLTWESTGSEPFVRLQWQKSSHRLTMTDMAHGRRAILLIQP